MKNKINILELFSGIGGFSKGLSDAGYIFDNHHYSEIDKHAIANYKYNFPHAQSIGSVTDVRGKRIPPPSIITFGSPCQDFSLAGKRKGMEGKRSSLILHAIRLIRECRPDIFIWENVKGAYSSNDGADFWGIISAFAHIGGYRLEWQLLNTSWFLPQNRERIYLVGHLAKDGRDFKGIFPIIKNDFMDEKTFIEKTISRIGIQIQPDRIASALNQRMAKMGIDDNYICVAQRGRNPLNPSDRSLGTNTEQRLEPNSQGTTNTLTGVQKDNLIMINKPNHGRSKGEQFEGIAPSLLSQMGTGGDNIPYVNNIRRLTEIECERLQGFPDNWTEFGNYDGKVKSIPKTQRYKMLGNAVTVNVVKAIGERLIRR